MDREVAVKICFVSKESVKELRASYESEGEELLLFGFNGLGEVSYERELKGESDDFAQCALLSKAGKNIVVCGCITDSRGHRRKSALVAENGRLLGVSDMLHVIDGEYGCGGELRIYPTKLGKIGVLVGEDLYFPEAARSLALCGCDFIVCPFERVEGELPSVLLRASAFRYGTPILFCGRGYSMLADPRGEMAFASPTSPVRTEYESKKEYHLVERRIRQNR